MSYPVLGECGVLVNFERGTVIVVTESSGAFWEGYVERLADGTIMTPPDEGEVTTGKFPPNFVQELGVERADSPAQAPEVDADAAQQGAPPSLTRSSSFPFVLLSWRVAWVAELRTLEPGELLIRAEGA